MRTELAGIPPDPVEWGVPTLSLHDSRADLLSHIFDYAVTPMVGLDGPHHVTAGALMAGASSAELDARLKIDLTNRPASAYLLVRLRGKRGTAYFTPEWQALNRKIRIMQWLTPEGRNAMARLRLSDMRHVGYEFHGDVTARQARRYLAHFNDMGTHVVRSISYGEQLFQVFEATEDLLPGLRDSFAREAGQNEVSGPIAFGMAHLTRGPWVRSASPILSASGDAAAERVAHHEIWARDRPGEPRSLLSPGAVSALRRTAVLDALPARSVVGVSFASQALYLEDHRADAWNRIMRAGLGQRFPAVSLAGWRIREQFSLAGFLASAALAGDEDLCRAAAALPEIAFMLDFTGAERIAMPSPDCLALFAATDPGTGRAAETVLDRPAFDPARLTIPFVDGALCLTDTDGERWCLVEGVWLGRTEEGRPSITGAPAEPEPALVVRHAARLGGYVGLLGELQGPGFPPGVATAMRRCAAWLAEVTSHDPRLAALRWRAMQVARRAARGAPGTIVLDRALENALAELLHAAVDLLALPADSAALGSAARLVDGRLRVLYRRLPFALDAAELDRRSLAAGDALQRRFARLQTMPGITGQVAAAFAAGATLCLPPDLRRMPHGIAPGDDPYARLWNALLTLRARYAECRATVLAVRGRMAEAVDLLAREIIASGDGPPDPAGDVLASLDALVGACPSIDAPDRDMLLAEMTDLLELGRSVHLLERASDAGPARAGETGPQLHRLLLVLEMLGLCRAGSMPLAVSDSLAPPALAARIDQALAAIRLKASVE